MVENFNLHLATKRSQNITDKLWYHILVKQFKVQKKANPASSNSWFIQSDYENTQKQNLKGHTMYWVNLFEAYILKYSNQSEIMYI